jgi:hypothetical protein
MTDDRDPTLRTLFANAKQDLAGEAFTTQVMSQTKLKHSAVIGRIGVGLVLAPCAWLLATLLQDVVHLLTQSITLSLIVSLIDLDDRWLAQMLSPVNNIASLIAFGLIGLRIAYEKIFL